MERAKIFEKIESIRADQDTNWPRDERRKQMYSFLPPHVLVLRKQLEKLEAEWYASKTEDCEQRLFHIAACAVRALEEITPFK